MSLHQRLEVCACVHVSVSSSHRYEKSDKRWKVGYEAEFIDYLESLVRDLDRRIKRGKERLQRSADHKEKVEQSDRDNYRRQHHIHPPDSTNIGYL